MKKGKLKFKKWLYKQSKENLIEIILSYWKGEKESKWKKLTLGLSTGKENTDTLNLETKY